MNGRGFKVCVIGLHREHFERARAFLEKDDRVEPGSIRHDGERLRWRIDLATIPEGEGPALELMQTRDIERVVRS